MLFESHQTPSIATDCKLEYPKVYHEVDMRTVEPIMKNVKAIIKLSGQEKLSSLHTGRLKEENMKIHCAISTGSQFGAIID